MYGTLYHSTVQLCCVRSTHHIFSSFSGRGECVELEQIMERFEEIGHSEERHLVVNVERGGHFDEGRGVVQGPLQLPHHPQ